jgi:hypothetical protein
LKKLLLNNLILLSAIFFYSCANKVYLDKIDAYLNASSVETKAKYMSDNYRSFFMKKEGEGNDKLAYLKDFNDWDGQLNPDVKVLQHQSKDNVWLVQFIEQNDFSKLIGFPGWKGSMSVAFDANGLINETIYFPDSTNPSYKKWLQPALDWLRINFPNELNEVYQNNKLVKTEFAANKWKDLLRKWNASKLN